VPGPDQARLCNEARTGRARSGALGSLGALLGSLGALLGSLGALLGSLGQGWPRGLVQLSRRLK
jgi:hypothetical protein